MLGWYRGCCGWEVLLNALAALQETVDAMWEVLRGFLESPDMRKAWHNYSFDRHVLGNIRAGGQPIQAAGFHADTMHMARLWDSSRKGKGYSLEALSGWISTPSLDRSIVSAATARGIYALQVPSSNVGMRDVAQDIDRMSVSL